MVFDVLRRADCSYVPSSVITEVCKDNIPKGSLLIVLVRLANAGILESKKGIYGGYKQARSVSMLELFRLFSPKLVPDPKQCYGVDTLERFMCRIYSLLSDCVVYPEKLVPLEFHIDAEDVETASTEAHGPTDGPPIP